jgi:hypothetical protein
MTTATDTCCHLNELCSECGHRKGAHAAQDNACPNPAYRTQILQPKFLDDQVFEPSGTYCNENS